MANCSAAAALRGAGAERRGSMIEQLFPPDVAAIGLTVAEWPAGTVGSLAHCAAAAVLKGRIRGIGFDVEPAETLPAEIRDLICTACEQAWIESQPLSAFGDWYIIFFSAKESAFKAAYAMVRVQYDFWKLEITLEPQSNRFSVSNREEQSPRLPDGSA